MPQGDALTGEPLTTAEEADYAAWADRAAREEFSPAENGTAYEGADATREAGELMDGRILFIAAVPLSPLPQTHKNELSQTQTVPQATRVLVRSATCGCGLSGA